MDADELLTTTRAVRKRLDLERPVEREVILDCLRISQQAPTGSNAQGWQWLVITDQDKRSALAKLYADASEDYFSASASVVEGQTARVLDSARYLREHMAEVPVLVIPCIKGRVEKVPPAMLSGFFGSILPAAWSFMLALRSRGLGSSFTTLHLLEVEKAAELLGIPDNYVQCGLIPVAYTKGLDFKPAKRPPVEEIVHWDSW